LSEGKRHCFNFRRFGSATLIELPFGPAFPHSDPSLGSHAIPSASSAPGKTNGKGPHGPPAPDPLLKCGLTRLDSALSRLR
jgi:hypothetical protein